MGALFLTCRSQKAEKREETVYVKLLPGKKCMNDEDLVLFVERKIRRLGRRILNEWLVKSTEKRLF